MDRRRGLRVGDDTAAEADRVSERADRHSRSKRAQQLRTSWRKGEDSRGAPEGLTPDEELQRQRDALDASDRIRAEAPDDLETRRRGDQLEREIRDSAQSRGEGRGE